MQKYFDVRFANKNRHGVYICADQEGDPRTSP
jgi:hypothetical protein